MGGRTQLWHGGWVQAPGVSSHFVEAVLKTGQKKIISQMEATRRYPDFDIVSGSDGDIAEVLHHADCVEVVV